MGFKKNRKRSKAKMSESPSFGGAGDPNDAKFIDAKAFLQTSSTKTGDNVYDHLARVLSRLLTNRPQDAVDIFEDVSRLEKRDKFFNKVDTIIDKPDKSTETKLAEIQRTLFVREGEDEDPTGDSEETETPLPNLQEIAFFFEQAGVGLGREECYRVWLSLKALVEKYPLETIRLWGKMYGINENYYIAEVKFQEGKDEEEEAEAAEEAAALQAQQEAEEKAAEEEENEEEDPVPKVNYKAPAQPPKEAPGTGANKYVYYVCNAPGKPWSRLPLVTPHQISVSRKIRKFLTGRLDAPVVSYPPFPGNEANYLRAQIARISAGTQISPAGFFRFDEENEAEAEEEGGRDSYVHNEEYEGMPVREFADSSLANWVHHAQHILPQGRTRWWNPKASKSEEEEMENEEEEEEKEEPDEPEPEVGPQLLTPLSEDAQIDLEPAWTARISSNLVSQYAIAVVSSNLWPGAFAFATDKKYENIYVGWGQKYSTDNMNPQLPPMPQEEFISGPEITEAEDPSPQDEAALRKAQEQAEEQEEEHEEEEEEQEEEQDDD